MTERAPSPTNIGLPTRTITITGEYSARMVQNAVRASRIEKRAIQIAMAPPAVRDAGRRAMDRFAQACAQFEAELSSVERELESSSRGGRTRGNGPAKTANAQVAKKPAAKPAAKPVAKPAPAKTAQAPAPKAQPAPVAQQTPVAPAPAPAAEVVEQAPAAVSGLKAL